jgi:hypothetical protein
MSSIGVEPQSVGGKSMLEIPAVRDVVQPILEDALRPYGLEELEFRAERDHDGDPMIVAIARYGRASPKLEASIWIDAVVKAVAQLASLGDNRFVHLRHVYPYEEEAPDGNASAARRRSVRSARSR